MDALLKSTIFIISLTVILTIIVILIIRIYTIPIR